MKTLTLLRHAKSGWDDPATRDFDRPLNPRGRRAARTVAREMHRLGLGFDRILASPARRVVETIAEVAAEFGPLPADYDERLYLASPQTLLEIVHEAPRDAKRLLLVGHNPGLESLALILAGAGPLRSEVELKYPTATLAEIVLPVASWTEVRAGAGELRRFIRPRDLDPELGPED
ncbi:MAG: phosphohistidine phosphatase [Sphingomonadales bacterium]|jgi:phosphohistidine phosphatase|nr:phosphohistidine phosphatase [Sphingomonadales bacterium]MEA3048794.1 phosphohistidine phosphatase [Sphingomonadales bacterium]